ncbi:MAG: hypothetical protein HZA53_15900 [Planctomycetes bacterium]|nr:hypothetical protein [Planctomycetota bacterium]
MIKLLVLNAVVAGVRLVFDPNLTASLHELAERHPLAGDGTVYLLVAPIGALLTALVTVVLFAWLPSKLSDLVHGESMDSRWTWGVVAASLPFLAWVVGRTLKLDYFASFPANGWWLLLVLQKVAEGCACWWLQRKHGVLTSWSAAAALAAIGCASSILFAWMFAAISA